MNSQSIKKLRRKFIFISMASITAVVLFIASFINAASILSTRLQIRYVLDSICDNNGDLPEEGSKQEEADSSDSVDLSLFSVFSQDLISEHLYPEFRYATRYFAVLFDTEDEVSAVKTGHIAAVEEAEAEELARSVRSRFMKFGNYGVYYYMVDNRDDGSCIVVFLDCTAQVSINLRIFYASLIICFGGILLVFWPVYIFSGTLIRPELRAIERQKQFITNASHELKTPLAVIRANTEVLEMMQGENEWTASTMRQVDRMSGLIGNLVQIARAEEKADKSKMTSFSLSKAVLDTAETFEPVASSDGKKLLREINEGIEIVADEGAMRQLASLLIDNAIKYCDEKGSITVRLDKKGKNARLTVSNDYAEGAGIDYSRFFERFYRKDASHNTEKGGYGIGLSIAESITRQYGGSISAAWANGVISFICIIP
ncbi:MAG: HAMP domain-containing histidine kinase [Lachnospiraceae bacterium]|nr:HAMP domain-containing histidine kinase [Lachnospiraceae bacterium]